MKLEPTPEMLADHRARMERDKDLNSEVKYDTTDHLWFKCQDCKCWLIVEDVVSGELRDPVNPKVTYIFLKCPKCKAEGKRKIYWKEGHQRNAEMGIETISTSNFKKP